MKYIQLVWINLFFYISVHGMQLPQRARSDSNSSDETIVENWSSISSIERELTPPLAQLHSTIAQDSTRLFARENKKSWQLPIIVIGILSFSCTVGFVSKKAECFPVHMHNSMHRGSNYANSSNVHAYLPCINFDGNYTQSLRGFKK